MTSKERAGLRAKANTLEPIIQIGKDGIGENLISQTDDALDARELIKLRVHLDTAPEKPRELAGKLAQALGADVVQVIGGVIVLYRKADEEKIAQKRKKNTAAKTTVRKKVKIKGKRQRQREKEAKNPYAKYERPKYYGR